MLCCIRNLFLVVAILGSTKNALADVDHVPPAYCVNSVVLKPNEKRTIATVIVNDSATYTSRTIRFAGRVVTDDGANRFADVWLKRTDAIHWGTNEDFKNALGPTFNVKTRIGFLIKGSAEIRVRATNSRTTICLCTKFDADDEIKDYSEINKACMQKINEGIF